MDHFKWNSTQIRIRFFYSSQFLTCVRLTVTVLVGMLLPSWWWWVIKEWHFCLTRDLSVTIMQYNDTYPKCLCLWVCMLLLLLLLTIRLCVKCEQREKCRKTKQSGRHSGQFRGAINIHEWIKLNTERPLMAPFKRVSHRDTETQFEMTSNLSIHVFFLFFNFSSSSSRIRYDVTSHTDEPTGEQKSNSNNNKSRRKKKTKNTKFR